jgi:hypothetical protein
MGLFDPSPNWRDLRLGILTSRVSTLQPALDGVKAQFSLPWAVPEGHDWRERLRSRHCATWYAIRSRLALEDGRPSAALDHSLDAIELGSLVCRNGWIEDRYDGQACQFTGLERAERILPSLPADRLLQQIQRVRRLRQSWPPITETLANERVTSLRKCTDLLREVERKSLWEQLDLVEQKRSPTGVVTGGWSTPPHVYAWPAWQEVLKPHGAARAELDHYFHELIAASARPAPHGVPHTDPTSIWVKPFAASSFTGPYRGEWPRNNLAILETAMAVRLYHVRMGRYPRALEEVPKAWLPEVPLDVWNQPIAYRLVNGKGLVYSWGPDQKDHGGQPVNPTAVIHGAHGDLVFGRLCDEDWPRPKPRVLSSSLRVYY